jgi:hypothetical protein
MRLAIAAGVILGVAYTLSPLTVLCMAALAALSWRVARDLTPRERSWFITIVVAAIAIRLAAIAVLMLTADASRPFATFFGDEELFKNRTVWLRNIGLGVPVSPADMIYVFDDVGRSSYLYLLAYVQALAGVAPYGNNVLNATVYVSAVIALFAFIRRFYGQFVALSGAIFLLFVPSLLSWSVSVLKEPFYIFAAVLELICAVGMARASTLWRRVACAIAVFVLAFVLNSLRIGGMELVVVGTSVGLTLGLLATRPRAAFAAMVIVPLVFALVVTRPGVQQRAIRTWQNAAYNHWGHVSTPGYSYKLLDERLYADELRTAVYTMTLPELSRYSIRAVWSFITVPRSSQIESRSALAYLPEQALWYAMVLLTPIGVVAGMRRDPIVTCLLLAHGLTAAGMVALTSGNIGTLIRHRGLTFPYFVWLAALGACTVVYWVVQREPRPRISVATSGEPA